MSLKKVSEVIRNNNSFLITSHTNLEGDALGSELAFYRLLRAKGKRAVIVNEDSLPYGYDFLPGNKVIHKLNHNLKNINFDVFVALDCSDLKRPGEVYKLNNAHKPILNIDHHISNTKFGDINWVDPKASCCCEMVYKIYKELSVALDKESALCIYVGMATDTGHFRYTNTNSVTHSIVSELLKYNVDVSRVYRYLYGDVPFSDMQLVSGVLKSVTRESDGRLIWFEMTKLMLKGHKKIVIDLGDYILSFGRRIKGAEVVVLFKENLSNDGQVRVNFRSHGKVDVNMIAKAFGGGGHFTASGCTIKGSLDSVKKRVLQKIKDSL
ncbi:MAG: bifunctional oligoribonuclease/PAP phosphatase NrnA [Candidatus Omnitrophota bacterium]|nr:bifunctional oligoribonuclease/PAP phosphatase NrnA [Candidatus Omnitrophota bacterium]MBU1929536.1 bifunctional oligoribonuclease/PAP phosphatase NrnA [Candidatus Omnitrophota bacterium]MBU2035823.1 bifunctional oligoribonuclease/PAP phosphatase NrnA [Candidatus Omnitrophota bacterium]MBU2221391.1 bifunctional oligoribonuclease/PAP phosphatase NrnA [Candidatus Omnitrophota bacterium]MBU2258395.1 bifunctional oligoribonuclease/PAP phosphatase NrnA [Candidatus Omnitrophota bacterium]